MSDPRNLSERLFFALWPDDPLRARLDALAGELHGLRGGRRSRPDSLHLTLVFIGEVAVERLPEVLAVAQGIAVPSFEVVFDQAGCWRHNRIAHLAASHTPTALRELVTRLEAGLDAAEIGFDHRAYVPHVTLLRKADCSAPAEPQMESPALVPIRWLARDFVLVTSSRRSGGALYQQLGRWPLL